MKVTFIHPDLGIGGAERLVIDAATAMKKNGHEVFIVTNSYTPSHCFEETKEFNIKSIDIFPRTIFNRFAALCAYIRMCIAATYISLAVKTDLVFCDSISACMIVFRLFRALGIFKAKIMYYCHFPDLFLTDRKTLAKTIYRYFIDSIESLSTKMADVICVNSNFTADIVRETFKNLKKVHVLYPTLNTEFFDNCESVAVDDLPDSAKYVFLSINRFERKKNIDLALKAFAELKDRLQSEVYKNCFLIIAGGYDKNNEENLLYYRDLREQAVDLQISTKQILFLRSPSDDVKVTLLRRALAVLYTPSREHFGIVPIEAMYMKCCVIAVNSGGPKESLEDGLTGFLVEPEPAAFAEKMVVLVNNERKASLIGEAGHHRVIEVFSMDKFKSRLEEIMRSTIEN